MTLTSSMSFTRRICSRRSCRSLKVDCAVMEYTKANPWPFFMYRSLIAVNCSYRSITERRSHEQPAYIHHVRLHHLISALTYCSSRVQDLKHTLLPVDLDLLLEKSKQVHFLLKSVEAFKQPVSELH